MPTLFGSPPLKFFLDPPMQEGVITSIYSSDWVAPIVPILKKSYNLWRLPHDCQSGLEDKQLPLAQS